MTTTTTTKARRYAIRRCSHASNIALGLRWYVAQTDPTTGRFYAEGDCLAYYSREQAREAVRVLRQYDKRAVY